MKCLTKKDVMIFSILLQDFEALTPNLLARTIETIEGGGVVCVLLQNMSSLKKLYTMTMVWLDIIIEI